ncbi:MAG: hypothetical protein KDJ99_21005, partial [Candidatus Competibacteraceae bacterium]|nr:hypothetical protein [Candidatus Competibacteraceae bacterium]
MHSLIELAAMLEHDPIYNGLPTTVTAAANQDEPGWLSKVEAELRGKRAELNRLTWQKTVAGKEYQRLVEHLEPSKRKRFKARWENRQDPEGASLDDPFEALVVLWCALGLKSRDPDGSGEARELPFSQLIQDWPLPERQKGTITNTSRQVTDETLLAFLHRYSCPIPFALQNNALPPTPQQVPIHSAILEKERTESLAYIELGIFLRVLKYAEPENDPYDLVLFWLRDNPDALDIRAFHPRWPTSNEISYSDVQIALSRAQASDKLPDKATDVTVTMGNGHDCAAPVRHLLISRECIAGVYAGLGRSTFPWPTDPAMPADTDWDWLPVGVSQSKSYRTFIL